MCNTSSTAISGLKSIYAVIGNMSSDWILFEQIKRWLVIHWLRMRNLFIFFFKKQQLTETTRLAKFEPPNLSSTFYSEAAFIILLRIMSYHNDSLSLMTSFSLSNMWKAYCLWSEFSRSDYWLIILTHHWAWWLTRVTIRPSFTRNLSLKFLVRDILP